MSDIENAADATQESPLSLRRLTSAFAAMLGRKPTTAEAELDELQREVPTSTRTITEAILFVGRPDNLPLTAQAIASTMRDVTADEVVQAVAELNAEYAEDDSALCIAESSAGYRMVLREDLGRLRDKFYGKVQQATLSPQAMEVLSVIAYRQPVTATEIDQLRGQKSQSLASSLVRRGLARLVRSEENPKQAHYVTTDRFLKVFGLTSIDQIPQAEEFEAA